MKRREFRLRKTNNFKGKISPRGIASKNPEAKKIVPVRSVLSVRKPDPQEMVNSKKLGAKKIVPVRSKLSSKKLETQKGFQFKEPTLKTKITSKNLQLKKSNAIKQPEKVNQSDSNIVKLTSVNPEAIKKISKKKTTFKSIASTVLLVASLAAGAFAYYYASNYDDTPGIDPIPVSDIVDEMQEEDLGTAIINGQEVNLNQMKKDLGSMYYYGEPLTDEQVDTQFLGIIDYIKEIRKVNKDIVGDANKYDIYGYKEFPEEVQAIYNQMLSEDSIAMETSYREQYPFVYDTYYEYTNTDKCLDYARGAYPFEKLTSKEKRAFVSHWKQCLELSRKAYEKAGLSPESDIKLSSIDFEKQIVYIKMPTMTKTM